MLMRPPPSPPLFPYTTLFRSENPALPEDTLDLAERLDPVRTLLRRTAGGDRAAASALVDVLGPRIHGLAVHVTGSSARAGKLTRSEEHTSELQSRFDLVCRLL